MQRRVGVLGSSFLGALLVAGCTSSGSAGPKTDPARTPAPESSPAAQQPWVVERIHTGSRPCATLGAAGSVWVADINDNDVKRLDPATGKTLARYKTAAGPCGMAYGAGSVWAEDYTGNAVTRIDVRTGRTRDIAVGGAPYDVTFAAGAAWVTNYNDGTVTRIDARTDKTATITVGVSPIGIAPAAGAVWVVGSGDSTVTRIDVRTRKTRTIKVSGSLSWTAYDGDRVWISDAGDGQLVELDARTGRVVRRSKIGPTPNDGDAYDGAVWIPDKSGDLYRVDEQTHEVTGPFALGAGNPFVLDGYDGKLWIADFGGTHTLAVDPAKLPG